MIRNDGNTLFQKCLFSMVPDLRKCTFQNSAFFDGATSKEVCFTSLQQNQLLSDFQKILKFITQRFLNSVRRILVFCSGVNKVLLEFPMFLSDFQKVLKFKTQRFLNVRKNVTWCNGFSLFPACKNHKKHRYQLKVFADAQKRQLFKFKHFSYVPYV